MNESDHFVQFYERDVSLVEAVSGFIGAGLEAGESCIVIATQAHREDIQTKLIAHGIDLAAVGAQTVYPSRCRRNSFGIYAARFA